MKKDRRLIEALKPIILAKMKNHPNDLHEGFFDKVMNHISGILQKTTDKRFKRDLDILAKSSPEGKSRVANFKKYTDQLESDIELFNRMRKSGEL